MRKRVFNHFPGTLLFKRSSSRSPMKKVLVFRNYDVCFYIKAINYTKVNVIKYDAFFFQKRPFKKKPQKNFWATEHQFFLLTQMPIFCFLY